MENITIEGMDEHDFRFSIEDMLRCDKVDEAVKLLRDLVEPYAGDDRILPSRFLRVSSSDLEFAGWQRLGDRLYLHDRPSRPISAIGVALSDYRILGGRGPTYGWMPPFLKTFYFSDEAFPFSDATRHDLLDGYTREGFGWQGDYQATDATLSVKGMDDLYGAIVELENRLMDSLDPPLAEIHAGTIGACYLAALIHQSLRATIREQGLPRPLCVLAACDGVFPFFDAPVAGLDECTVMNSGAAAAEEPGSNDDQEDEEAPAGDTLLEASLLSIVSHKGTKRPVISLGEEEARQAAELTERAGAQRMLGDEAEASEALQQGFPIAERPETDELDDCFSDAFSPDSSESPDALPSATDLPCEAWDGSPDMSEITTRDDQHDRPDEAGLSGGAMSDFPPLPDPIEEAGAGGAVLAEEPVEVPQGHRLRSQIIVASPDAGATHRDWRRTILNRFRRLIFRR